MTRGTPRGANFYVSKQDPPHTHIVMNPYTTSKHIKLSYLVGKAWFH